VNRPTLIAITLAFLIAIAGIVYIWFDSERSETGVQPPALPVDEGINSEQTKTSSGDNNRSPLHRPPAFPE